MGVVMSGARNDESRSARYRLARRVRVLRAARGWSQESLAELAGLHRTYISAVERMEHNIGIDSVDKIARAFGVSMSELLAPGDEALRLSGED